MIYRYVRAFFIALRMTLRGESVPPQTPLAAWMAQGIEQLDVIDQLVAHHDIDPQQVVLHIDARDITMSTILRTVRFHLTNEYPVVLRQFSEHGLTVVRASNLDDHYRLTRLETAPELRGTPVEQAVARLAVILEAIPENA
ncbi:MAG TPA: hypothetical protein VKY59_21785 [Spirillospora sp.]|nr:hypothetical protein [Spirillospora sp.]